MKYFTGIIHVYPIDDWIEHKTDDPYECLCRPHTESYGYVDNDDTLQTSVIVYHNMVNPEYKLTITTRLTRVLNWLRNKVRK